MLGHDFHDMPGRLTDVGDNPHETVMLLRCRFCMKTPMKARTDGCPINELETNGTILLSDFNPAGVSYFNDRACVTCGEPIMGHRLMRGSDAYWCPMNVGLKSGGIEGCVTEVEGVTVPQEPIAKDLSHNN